MAVKRCGERLLELSEEAKILGAYQGRLWYQIVSQKSEGGSLMEGGGRAWFWDESEIVDGGLQLIGKGKGQEIELPLLQKFKCFAQGGYALYIVVVLLSDLILKYSMALQTLGQYQKEQSYLKKMCWSAVSILVAL